MPPWGDDGNALPSVVVLQLRWVRIFTQGGWDEVAPLRYPSPGLVQRLAGLVRSWDAKLSGRSLGRRSLRSMVSPDGSNGLRVDGIWSRCESPYLRNVYGTAWQQASGTTALPSGNRP